MPVTIPKCRCVVADDVRASRELLQRCLTQLDIEVAACNDGQSAWELILKSKPSLVVTDIEMPRLTGIQLLGRIRASQDDAIRNIPVVLMTSLLDSEISDIVAKYGTSTVLIKPLCKRTTCTIIEQILKGGSIESVYDPNDAFAVIRNGQAVSPTLRRLVRDADS